MGTSVRTRTNRRPAMATMTPLSGAIRGSETQGGAQVVDPRRRLPRELLLGATEVAVGRGLPVDRAPQVEITDDGGRAQVEDLADGLG